MALDLVDELGAEFVTNPPCQAALAGATFRQEDGELGRDIEMLSDHLHTAVRYVGNRAVTRQRAGAELDLGETPAHAAFALASIC